MPVLKAPFPWFGGKSRIASLVWARLGDVDNYVEAFAGSIAVLLRRPHPPRVETVNDLDGHVTNVWRSLQRDPEATAAYADWPVSELDLHARHRWLVYGDGAAEFRERMRADPDHFDPKRAGWWVWGICCWIGSNWCEESPSADLSNKRPRSHRAAGSSNSPCNLPGVLAGDVEAGKKRPKLSGGSPGSGALGTGVHSNGLHAKRPVISQTESEFGRGVHGRPQLADAFARGRGRPGRGEAGACAARRAWLIDWFHQLADRLRVVRVCCGKWLRVCDSPSVTTRLGLTGLFLDPPYPIADKSRADGLYSNDRGQDLNALRDEVLSYCRERGPDKQMRICVAGYDTDGYAALVHEGWTEVAWRAVGGYGNRSEKGRSNAGRERLWFSPHCLTGAVVPVQAEMFGDGE